MDNNDRAKLMALGFNAREIQATDTIIKNCDMGGSFETNARKLLGENIEDGIIRKLKYIRKIVEERDLFDALNTFYNKKVSDDTFQQENMSGGKIYALNKHYDKMYNDFNIGESKLQGNEFVGLATKEINTKVVCRDLEGVFEEYNYGKKLDIEEEAFKLEEETKSNISFLTYRKPIIKRGEENLLKTEQASLMIVQKNPIALNDNEDTQKPKMPVLVTVKKEFVGKLNKWVIVVSTKAPTYHCGMVVLLTTSGDRIYVYATEYNGKIRQEENRDRKVGQIKDNTVIVGYGLNKYDKLVIDKRTGEERKVLGLETYLIGIKNRIERTIPIAVRFLVNPEHTFEEGKILWQKDRQEDTSEEF